MDQKRFERELEALGLGAYGIGRKEDGGYSIHVEGVDFISAGSDPFVLFQEMIDHLNNPAEAKEPSTCSAVTAGLTTITDKLLEFFGDANAVYAFSAAIAGPHTENTMTSDLDIARKVNRDRIVAVFKEAMSKAFEDEFNEDNNNVGMDQNEANLHRTVQEAFAKEAPKHKSVEELRKLSPEDLDEVLKESLEGLGKLIGFDAPHDMEKIREEIAQAMGVPAHMIGRDRHDADEPQGTLRKFTRPKAKNMGAKYPRVAEGISGLIYLLLGESGNLTNSYDCYVLGHKSREDATYKDEIGTVETDRIVGNYDRDLNHQMNLRLREALKAFATYQ